MRTAEGRPCERSRLSALQGSGTAAAYPGRLALFLQENKLPDSAGNPGAVRMSAWTKRAQCGSAPFAP